MGTADDRIAAEAAPTAAAGHAAEVAAYLQQHETKGLLRFITCGSVDDGKSTLIGRLLHDTKLLFDDQLAALEKDSVRHGTQGDEIDFALLVDGLAAEREQGITIDVAYRYFSTDKRKFIVADCPGHEQYTRNMATGASTADLAIVLVDARKGLLTQTRRHSYIVSLLGIRHVLLAVNKMDLVDYDRAVFDDIVAGYRELAASVGIPSVQCIPLSALKGDNMLEPSAAMPWYDGPTLLDHLESVDVDRFEVVEERRTVVPRHRGGRLQHVVALERRQRDALHRRDADGGGQLAVARDDVVEHRPVVVDQVHLVHRQQHVPDAEQRDDVAVAARLRQQSLARVDQHDRQVGGGGAGGHVARVLLVARAVGDDELALVRAEVAVGDVDRDALLALGGQAVDQQREVDLVALRAVADAVLLERGQLVVEQQLGVVQQPADERALAVVDAAAGDEAQQALGLVLLQVGGDLGGVPRGGRRSGFSRDAIVSGAHQKYPSCFFFSIDADGSWSITRPWRSDVVATSISAMIASSVSASDSIAPVSG